MLDGGLSWELGFGAFVLLSTLTLGTLYARLSTDDVLEGLRKDIYEHIEHNPGDHLAGITRHFNISSSSARHHLDVLEWSEMIVSHKAEKLRHYYPNRNGYRIYAGAVGYKEVLAALRNPTSREMVKFLMGSERANQAGIASALGLNASTVNWHAKRLIAAGIIARVREGKDIHYSLNRDLDLARAMALVEGHEGVLEDAPQAAEGASS
jgi:predicted transcriptional regulator